MRKFAGRSWTVFLGRHFRPSLGLRQGPQELSAGLDFRWPSGSRGRPSLGSRQGPLELSAGLDFGWPSGSRAQSGLLAVLPWSSRWQKLGLLRYLGCAEQECGMVLYMHERAAVRNGLRAGCHWMSRQIWSWSSRWMAQTNRLALLRQDSVWSADWPWSADCNCGQYWAHKWFMVSPSMLSTAWTSQRNLLHQPVALGDSVASLAVQPAWVSRLGTAVAALGVACDPVLWVARLGTAVAAFGVARGPVLVAAFGVACDPALAPGLGAALPGCCASTTGRALAGTLGCGHLALGGMWHGAAALGWSRRGSACGGGMALGWPAPGRAGGGAMGLVLLLESVAGWSMVPLGSVVGRAARSMGFVCGG